MKHPHQLIPAKTPHRRAFPMSAAGCLAALLHLAGCSPLTEQEKAYFESRRELERQEEVLTTVLTAGEAYAEQIEKVKASPAPEGPGTTGDWIAGIPKRENGEVWFARWQARSPTLNQFEVRYTYTLMDADYNAEERGLRWRVDTLLDRVEGPQDIPKEELKSKPRQGLTPREQHKERVREFSLE